MLTNQEPQCRACDDGTTPGQCGTSSNGSLCKCACCGSKLLFVQDEPLELSHRALSPPAPVCLECAEANKAYRNECGDKLIKEAEAQRAIAA